MSTRDYGTITLRFLQQTQPWVIPYSPTFEQAVNDNNGLGHLMGAHAVTHAIKTVGQLAAVFETLDHTGAEPSVGQLDVLAGRSADLVTAAMRLANLYGFDLATSLVERSEEKNRVMLPDWSTDRDQSQADVYRHCGEVFGEEALSLEERARRFGEEAIELLQATGLSRYQVGRLVAYVYDRPIGEIGQEIGGTMVTLKGLAQAANVSLEQEEAKETARFFAIDPDAFRAKHASKVAAGV